NIGGLRVKYECEKVFLECDKGSFEINDTRIEEVTFEGTEIDNLFERVKYEGTFTIISGWDSLLRDILWLEMRKVLKIITGKMMMGVLGMIIIRSQDKTDLVKADWINVDKECVYAMFGDMDNFKKIGEYEDEKRAIQVLDNIQRFIEGGTRTDSIDSYKVRSYRNRIFQMPVK
ncbi:hypothetical protein MJW66_019770, partial [Clostridioides difficile]|nr:hypothetical protein [Clostridioides difficile]